MEKTLQPRRKSLSQKSPNEKEKLIRNQNEYSPPHARSNATNVKTNPMTELEIIKERGLGRNTRRSTPTQRKKYSRHKSCKETTHSNLIHQKNQMKQIVYQGNIHYLLHLVFLVNKIWVCSFLACFMPGVFSPLGVDLPVFLPKPLS